MTNYLDILSGKNKTPIAYLLRLVLVLPSLLYGIIIRLRNICYDLGLLKQHKVSVPVICVGNLTAGGTGKTPMVIWLCKYLREKGLSVALLSRGYKADADGNNDEMKLLADSLPDTRFYVGSDRLANARQAIESGATVLVMDDGFQHRRLARDLNILMIDATAPFGYGKIIPAGLLREPITGIKRAGACVVSRVDIADPMVVNSAKQIIVKHKNIPIAECAHTPSALYGSAGQEIQLSDLKGKKVTAFCSIGNPAAFISTLQSLGADVRGKYFFDDHSEYDSERMDILCQLSEDAAGQWLITTEKDWVKLRQLPEIAMIQNLYWLKITMTFKANQPQLQSTIDSIL